MNIPISEIWSQVSDKDRIPFETYEQGGKGNLQEGHSNTRKEERKTNSHKTKSAPVCN